MLQIWKNSRKVARREMIVDAGQGGLITPGRLVADNEPVLDLQYSSIGNSRSLA